MALTKPIHYGITHRGAMYMYDATEEITIDGDEQYHAVTGFSEGAASENITFTASLKGAIADTDDNGSGALRCTDVAHGLTSGQYVTLTGMGDAAHVGSSVVAVITEDIFDCTDISHNSDSDTGTWARGSSLTVNAGGDGWYKIGYNFCVFADAGNKNYKFEIVKNTTDLDEFAAERKMAIQDDLGPIPGSGCAYLVAGDVIWGQVKGTTDDTDLTIKHANVHMVKHH